VAFALLSSGLQLAKKNGLSVTPSRTEHMQLLGADRAGIVFNKNYDRIPITLRETFGCVRGRCRAVLQRVGSAVLLRAGGAVLQGVLQRFCYCSITTVADADCVGAFG
jgi:hypothetical protein